MGVVKLAAAASFSGHGSPTQVETACCMLAAGQQLAAGGLVVGCCHCSSGEASWWACHCRVDIVDAVSWQLASGEQRTCLRLADLQWLLFNVPLLFVAGSASQPATQIGIIPVAKVALKYKK